MASEFELRLAEILLREGVVSEAHLEAARALQSARGGKLGSILCENGYISEFRYAAVLAQHFHVAFVRLVNLDIDSTALASIPGVIASHYNVLPLDRTRGSLAVALVELDTELLHDLQLLTRCKMLPVISLESDIRDAIARYYGRGESRDS